MQKSKFLVVVLFSIVTHAFSQTISITGSVQDTASKTPLQYAVAMVVRIKDSTLVAYSHTNSKGAFSFTNIPLDTIEVVISHPKFNDRSFYVLASKENNVFDFGKITLPPKSQKLKEVVIYAYKDPVYYKGDTLVYEVDSFKVKPNATVEDLLKKLPGIKVDAQGKITAQGQAVDQVLVDGDEFFGTDPTAATKNLNANAVESVQIYEKKNDVSKEDGSDDKLKILNLKLKEDAKKGHFGKVSGASDFQKFYEGDVLANKFSNKQKISVFTLASNTPRSAFEWSDVNKYGLNNESNYSYNAEDDVYMYNKNDNKGIPQTLKSGIYYNDKIGKKTKIGFNYTYNNNQLKTKTDSRSQYFLTDTNYITTNTSESLLKNEFHNLNFSILQTLDSLTELEIKPNVKLTNTNQNNNATNNFLTDEDDLTRTTTTQNSIKSQVYEVNTLTKLKRNFKNRDRMLVASYNLSLNNNESEGVLKSSNVFYNGTSADSIMPVDQKKLSNSKNQTHNATITYAEPITKKIKLEFQYNYIYSLGSQDKKALNYAYNDYSVQDPLFTNDFENKRQTNRFGGKFIYEVKKQRFTVGSNIRQVLVNNTNLVTHQEINQKVNNLLPYLTYTYKLGGNSRFNFKYTTASTQPIITQLQPIPDNTNPNQVKLGNPNLLPTFENKFNANFNSYKPISGKYLWASINYNTINNAIVNSIAYDSIGRTITQAINVNGNYNASANFSGGLPLFSKKFEIDPHLNYNYSSYSSFINTQKNVTKNRNASGGLDVSVKLDTLEFNAGGNYTYNSPSSTLNSQSNEPYSSQWYHADIEIKLPFKFRLGSEVNYTINSKRSNGYNISYLLWNAALTKTFLKSENLIISFEAFDILNQNISTNRIIQDNVITDTKTNIISRYILLKVMFKFNSNKTKQDENGF